MLLSNYGTSLGSFFWECKPEVRSLQRHLAPQPECMERMKNVFIIEANLELVRPLLYTNLFLFKTLILIKK